MFADVSSMGAATHLDNCDDLGMCPRSQRNQAKDVIREKRGE